MHDPEYFCNARGLVARRGCMPHVGLLADERVGAVGVLRLCMHDVGRGRAVDRT